MEQIQERITYASIDAFYDLDPAKVFNVVEDLETYIYFAEGQAMKDNPCELKLIARLIGMERRLVLRAEVVNEPGFLTSFNLAELVLSDDTSKLTLATHKHPRVAIPSDDLHSIAKKYQTKSC